MAEQLHASQKPDNVLIALGHSLRTTDEGKPRRLAPRLDEEKTESGKYAEKLIG